MHPRIEDYALIGDCETAALVGRDGSIDWLCFPRFDSPALFAALLGTPENGRWRLAPSDETARSERAYREDTLILETLFRTETGTARLIDFMPPRDGRPNIIRIVEGVEGRVEFDFDLREMVDDAAVDGLLRLFRLVGSVLGRDVVVRAEGHRGGPPVLHVDSGTGDVVLHPLS